MDDDREHDGDWFLCAWFPIVMTVGVVALILHRWRRGRHWISDRIIDAGLWLQRDVDNSDIEEMLTEWGRQQRQHQRRRRNGKPPGPGYGGP